MNQCVKLAANKKGQYQYNEATEPNPKISQKYCNPYDDKTCFTINLKPDLKLKDHYILDLKIKKTYPEFSHFYVRTNIDNVSSQKDLVKENWTYGPVSGKLKIPKSSIVFQQGSAKIYVGAQENNNSKPNSPNESTQNNPKNEICLELLWNEHFNQPPTH
ncbi:hypothetical protein BVY03_01140 [bacterium K02(2017)]|nr:hypothetical protein BVY03_01140 [bacterium K02(2017)]